MLHRSAAEWDAQFVRQAAWTRATRAYLYHRAGLRRAGRVLDVGSGTGCVTEELAAATSGRVIGVDLDPAVVDWARQRRTRVDYQVGDAHDLPFGSGWFDVTACHFTLMWCRDSALAAREMVRVTKPRGAVLVCAEPDYGGRLDYPNLPIGHWQCEALQREGGDPALGRKLRALFALPAVRRVEIGVIPGLWDGPMLRTQFAAEWALWEPSLAPWQPAAELARVKQADWDATESGVRLAFLPVFYALVQL